MGGWGVFKHIGQVCERVSGRSSDPQRIVFLFLSQLNSVIDEVACDVTDLSRGVVPGETGGRHVGLHVPLRLTLQLKDISWETRVRNVF